MNENRGKKRKKSYYQPRSGKKASTQHQLAAKMQGVLITCNKHEKEAVKEAYNLLNEYADALFGIDQTSDDVERAETGEGDGGTDDIEQELEKEIEQLRKPAKERRFQNVRCRVGNCVFIKSDVPDVYKLVHKILTDASETGVLKTRFCLRITPVIATCAANAESIAKMAEDVFGEYFRTPFGLSQTYSIIYKARNNSSISRTAVISDLAGCIEGMNPLNKTDHTDPDYTVLVDVLCTVCCVGVVRDFKRLRKYNIHEVVSAYNIHEVVSAYNIHEVVSARVEKASIGDSKRECDVTSEEVVKEYDDNLKDDGGNVDDGVQIELTSESDTDSKNPTVESETETIQFIIDK